MDKKSESYKLWAVRKTVLQMCRDRGYTVSPVEINQTLKEFRKEFGNKPLKRELLILVARDDDPSDQLCVFFAQDKLKLSHVKGYCKEMDEDKINR